MFYIFLDFGIVKGRVLFFLFGYVEGIVSFGRIVESYRLVFEVIYFFKVLRM